MSETRSLSQGKNELFGRLEKYLCYSQEDINMRTNDVNITIAGGWEEACDVTSRHGEWLGKDSDVMSWRMAGSDIMAIVE